MDGFLDEQTLQAVLGKNTFCFLIACCTFVDVLCEVS